MYPRTNYKMTQKCLDQLSGTKVRLSYLSRQDRIDDAWKVIGQQMGFDPATVRPIDNKGSLFFSAIPLKSKRQITIEYIEECYKEIELLRLTVSNRLMKISLLEKAIRKAKTKLDEVKKVIKI